MTVLDDVALAAGAGDVLAIVGPSGCGKSTLLELLCRLRTPDAGTVAGQRAVLMPQHDALLDWLDAAGNAALPLRIAGIGSGEARARAVAMLGELGLGAAASKRPWQLSGGMRQRVAFARTLLSGAPVHCLDEPFGALDAITRAAAQRWLAGVLAREARTVVLVTHDVEEAALLADRIVVLSPTPGRVTAELTVAAPRPDGGRTVTDEAVVTARTAALAALGEAVVA